MWVPVGEYDDCEARTRLPVTSREGRYVFRVAGKYQKEWSGWSLSEYKADDELLQSMGQEVQVGFAEMVETMQTLYRDDRIMLAKEQAEMLQKYRQGVAGWICGIGLRHTGQIIPGVKRSWGTMQLLHWTTPLRAFS